MNYVPGTASLIDEIDKKHLVLLRDGRTLIGYLRSIDQFANLVFHQTVERIHVGKKFGDIPRGIFIVRGENVVLLGEIKHTLVHTWSDDPCMCTIDCPDHSREASYLHECSLLLLNYPGCSWKVNETHDEDVDKQCDAILQQVSIEEILEEQRLKQQTKQETEKVKMQALKDRGLSIPKADNLDEY
ncbi:U6 snRNA-associated Sm-like protein LSm1 isoform X1 [Entelurus aequoreus]|uniref:U6 snRNA-associated Sm-like protein LSm1 isoform X1 n=1 Tax=Entelurus aequoreus TaxID=161455 RepID=UPI002B1DB1DD|nr:U6 snRNA-associated Sm-like protein LSm1 isoform X1 [Entelurus aequoreus]